MSIADKQPEQSTLTDAEREARLRHAVEVGPYPPIAYWGDEAAFLLRLLDEERARAKAT